jgi:ssRNA-specific RNase YbeY (16S rRNA maturation enzyme)
MTTKRKPYVREMTPTWWNKLGFYRCYMLLHGFLHLLGYDHETSEKDAQKMFSLQDEAFDKLREIL